MFRLSRIWGRGKKAVVLHLHDQIALTRVGETGQLSGRRRELKLVPLIIDLTVVAPLCEAELDRASLGEIFVSIDDG